MSTFINCRHDPRYVRRVRARRMARRALECAVYAMEQTIGILAMIGCFAVLAFMIAAGL